LTSEEAERVVGAIRDEREVAIFLEAIFVELKLSGLVVRGLRIWGMFEE